ncbi:hypothetical protein ACH5RR_036140 [Cinchona calisaya]|uniref:Aluminum-activated malate transporter n=1 Tax=Cinchona calisaya TaxID=153742 RepID=A0ABD2Y3U7_9GENT
MDESQENLLSCGSMEGNANERFGYKCFKSLRDCFTRFYHGFQEFAKKALEMGRSDPRKVIFSLKMGLTLSLSSVLIFLEDSFTDSGQYSIWAILTVIVMFEFSIGALVLLSLYLLYG